MLDHGPELMLYAGERSILANVPNALAYQRVTETGTNGYLVRQYLYSSLYDRMRYDSAVLFEDEC